MTALPIRWVVQVGVSVLVIGILLVFIPLPTLMEAIRGVEPALWVAMTGLFLVCHVTAALKWRLLMMSASGMTKRLSVSAHFSGLVANLGLPGVTSGDVVRAAVGLRHTPDRAQLALASVADRLIDLVALLALSFTGLLLAGPRGGDPVRIVRIVGVMMAAGLCVGALAYAYLRRRMPARLETVAAASDLLIRRPGLLLVALGMSCCVQATFIAINWQLGRAVGLHADYAVWLLAWPLAKLVALVPVSIAGLGVREASLIGFMRPFGVPAHGIVAAGLLWQSVLMTGGLVGFALTRLLPASTATIQPTRATVP